MKTDISNRQDIELLMSSFYREVLRDALLAPVFEGLDMDAHIPVICDFWSSLLLDTQSYSGSPFDKHLRLHLTEAHFKQWLVLFEATLSQLFAGEKADLARQRANSIAHIFQSKLKGMGKLEG